MTEETDTFQLLIAVEGLQPLEVLWFGEGLMSPLMTTADALTTARIVPRDGWYIACSGCHPIDTAEWLAATGLTIVKDERKVALLIDALARAQASSEGASE
jgi:hypothetical protein